MSLHSVQTKAINRARQQLARAWSAPDYITPVEACLLELVPDTKLVLLTWGGEHCDRLVPLKPTELEAKARKTKWFRSGDAAAKRPYDPRTLEPYANCAVTGKQMQRIYSRPFANYYETCHKPLGFGGFLRVTLYDKGQMVAFCGLYRSLGERDPNPHEVALVQSIVPELNAGLSVRQTFDKRSLKAPGVAAIADAIPLPSFVLAEQGIVVYANKSARTAFPEFPDWLPALVRRPTECPAWVKRVPLEIGDARFWLLIADPCYLDVDRAPESPWAQRWQLPPRQARVAAGLARGLSDKEIAVEQALRLNTVRTYVRQLYQRMGVHSRTELVYAIRSFGKR